MKSKFVNAVCISWIGFLGLVAATPANAATLAGDTFQWTYLFDGGSTGFEGTFTTNGTASNFSGIFDLSATNNAITLNSTTIGTDFSNAPSFESIEIDLQSGPSPFQTVTIDPSTNVSFNSSDLQFTPTELMLTFTGSQWNSASVLALDVNQTPIPPSWSMMLIGFASLGFVGYYRMKRNTAASATI